MKIKTIDDENFNHYKKPSMVIGFPTCNWKCCLEANCDASMCQNSPLAQAKTIDITEDTIYSRYAANPLTSAIVLAGLEPFDSFEDMYSLISYFRQYTFDDIVIYTGYNRDEIQEQVEKLKMFKNIIIKYGRFIPNQVPHYDEVLGISLASNNQYAIKET